MRYVYIALAVILAFVVLMFKVQNLESVTVSLFAMSMTMPVSLLVLLVYVLGMLTGGFVVQFLRKSIRAATGRAR